MLAIQRSARQWLSWLALSLASIACKTKANPASGGPAGSASGHAREATCVAMQPQADVVLGTKSTKNPASDEEDAELDPVELPFSVELGDARSSEKSFVVPALESRAGANFAVLAVVDGASGAGSIVELGRVHGDVAPPLVERFRDRWLLAVPDGDVTGVRLRLMSLGPPYASPDLRRGEVVAGARRDASGHALSVSGEGALLVFATLDAGHGRLAVARIDPNEPKLKEPPKLLPAGDAEDVEAPRLIARPSGYYLAYLVWTPGARDRRRGKTAGTDAGAPEAPDPVEEGPSTLEILPLDRNGAVDGSPRRISLPGKHVRAFDIAPLADGLALLTYREARGPGLDQAEAYAVIVRPDGTVERRLWELGESSGVPSQRVDAAPAVPNRSGWVLVSAEQRLKLAPIGPEPLALAELREDAGLSGSEPLAVRSGRFLTAASLGTQRRLAVVDCTRSSRLQ